MAAGKEYTPAVFSYAVGVTPGTVRDWRRNGFIDGIGRKKTSGRWVYTDRDIAVAKAAIEAHRKSLAAVVSLRDAFVATLEAESWR